MLFRSNYHNDDQNWIQSVCLGEQVVPLADRVLEAIIYFLIIYAILGLSMRSPK